MPTAKTIFLDAIRSQIIWISLKPSSASIFWVSSRKRSYKCSLKSCNRVGVILRDKREDKLAFPTESVNQRIE